MMHLNLLEMTIILEKKHNNLISHRLVVAFPLFSSYYLSSKMPI
ncbi:hypothetical protein XSR1_10359 [Xenorhabdus szentirmaii DSM 16338]|uniref:Uncharacterized protein n=1 Tax=Xenorhabdus szentirmaii DSM 16338 TaxID=1427518 RepID=W1IUR9_9GAMM|nr:hypothetical protein XSR1_10359 [Xenorhabdus szentirmaii DSM 16338]